jgi:probable phosphoglycerate mutase
VTTYQKALLLPLLCTLSVAPQVDAKTIVIVRHGESENNVLNIVNADLGNNVYNLTEKGRQQVLATAERLKTLGYTDESTLTIYYSPLLRAQQSALIVAAELGVSTLIEEPRLMEPSFGSLEGRSTSAFPNGDVWDHTRAHLYGGETDDDVAERVAPFIKEIAQGGGDVILVTHGTTAAMILKVLGVKEGVERKFSNAEFRTVTL